MTSTEQLVLAERHGPIGVVTLNRPERRNSVSVEMCQQLYERLWELSHSDARVIVLRGGGTDFSVGADLKGNESSVKPTLELLGPAFHASTLLHSMPQVTIAAIDGGCAGAAMGWACSCDFRFATPRAKFATAFLKVAVSGDMGLVWSLVRLVGGARARELLFFSEKFGADEALRYDLITRIFPAESLHEEVLILAGELAQTKAFALRMMKANILSAERMDIADYIEIESARHLHITGDPSFQLSFPQKSAEGLS